MKKKNVNWLEKYKRISILSLFCLVFGILCLSICVVGFSLRYSNNVAYAYGSDTNTDRSNYVRYGEFSIFNNIAISNVDGLLNFNNGLSRLYTWQNTNSQVTFINHQLVIDSVASDTTIYFSIPLDPDHVRYYQFAFEVDNDNSSSGYSFTPFKSYLSGLNTIPSTSFSQATFTNKYYYYNMPNTGNYKSNYSFFGITVPTGVKLVINRVYIYNLPSQLNSVNYFLGFVLNDYVPNGYDNGYSDGLDDGRSEGYDQGYSEGRDYGMTIGSDEGYSQGYSDGEQVGFNNGYVSGSSVATDTKQYYYDTGYNTGYLAGINDNANHSFYGLFGAIFDVPVQTINGLLDFEILGVNLKGLYIGLISLTVALFILKIIFR